MDKISFGSASYLQAAAFSIRYRVFVLEQKIPPELEFDQHDDELACYFVYFHNKEAIATIRYQALNENTIQPDRFCVTKKWRKKGFGKKLLAFYEKQAIKDGYQRAILSAELTAIPFYLNGGYQIVSAPYLEDGIWCQKMEKILTEATNGY